MGRARFADEAALTIGRTDTVTAPGANVDVRVVRTAFDDTGSFALIAFSTFGSGGIEDAHAVTILFTFAFYRRSQRTDIGLLTGGTALPGQRLILKHASAITARLAVSFGFCRRGALLRPVVFAFIALNVVNGFCQLT